MKQQKSGIQWWVSRILFQENLGRDILFHDNYIQLTCSIREDQVQSLNLLQVTWTSIAFFSLDKSRARSTNLQETTFWREEVVVAHQRLNEMSGVNCVGKWSSIFMPKYDRTSVPYIACLAFQEKMAKEWIAVPTAA